LAQKKARIGQQTDVGSPVLVEIGPAAVGRNEGGAAPDLASVVETKITDHPGQNDQIGLAQSVAPPVAHLQGMALAQQPAAHAGEVDRDAQLLDRRRHIPGVGRVEQSLAAHEEEGPFSLGQLLHHPVHCGRGRRGRFDQHGARGMGPIGAGKEAVDVPVQIELYSFAGQALAAALDRVEVPHQRLCVEQVHRTLDKDRAGRAAHGLGKGLLHCRGQIAHAAHCFGPLHVGTKESHLVDVLQRTASGQRGGRGPAQHHQRRLGDLGVFDRGDGIGDTWPRGDSGHTGSAGEPGGGVGGKDGGRLMPGVDDADAPGFGRCQDGRDVTAAECEEKFDALGFQNIYDAFAAVHG